MLNEASKLQCLGSWGLGVKGLEGCFSLNFVFLTLRLQGRRR